MSCPISIQVRRRQTTLGEAFRSDDPLPKFVIVPNFLRPLLLPKIVTACQRARYSTFCGYSRFSDMTRIRTGFSEPNEKYTYISIHQRPVRPVPELVELRNLFRKRETLDVLSALSGISLRSAGGGVLTCWEPGSFIERHNDHVPGTKLVLSVSLTSRWHKSYGGATVYAWSGVNRAVRLQPRRNTAVLFAPFAGSIHWVEQVSEHAPPRRRFTWTAFFS